MVKNRRILFTSQVAAVVVLSILYFLLPTSTPHRIHSCFHDDFCKCVNHEAICNCSTRNQVINVVPLTLHNHEFEARTIRIFGCGDVVLHPTAFIHVPLADLEIRDVRSVNIELAAFYGVSSVQSIVIRDTTVHGIRESSFNSLSAAERIEFRNCTIANISHDAFYEISDIKNLMIIDSTIDIIKKGAFNKTANINSFEIINSVIGTMHSESMQLNGVANFNLVNVTVQKWEPKALILQNTVNIAISNSVMDVIPHSFIEAINVENLMINNTYINMLSQDCFIGLQSIKNATIIQNYFGGTEENALTPNMLSDRRWRFFGNRFHCDSGLCWLFDTDHTSNHSDFYGFNYCHSSTWLANNSLDSLASMFDDEDLCFDHSSGDGHDTEEGHVVITSSSSSVRYFFTCGIVWIIAIASI